MTAAQVRVNSIEKDIKKKANLIFMEKSMKHTVFQLLT